MKKSTEKIKNEISWNGRLKFLHLMNFISVDSNNNNTKQKIRKS